MTHRGQSCEAPVLHVGNVDKIAVLRAMLYKIDFLLLTYYRAYTSNGLWSHGHGLHESATVEKEQKRQ